MRESLKLLLTLLEEDQERHEYSRDLQEAREEVAQKNRELDKFAFPIWKDTPSSENEKHIPKAILERVSALKSEMETAQERLIATEGFAKGFELGIAHAIKRIERALYEEKDAYGTWRKVR